MDDEEPDLGVWTQEQLDEIKRRGHEYYVRMSQYILVTGYGERDITLKEVDECAWILIKAWEEAEGKPVNVSYYATFADMARALLKAGYKKVEDD